MLKKMSMRKLMVATLTLFILMILYLMPDSLMEKKLDLTHDNVEYVYSNSLDVIYLLDSNDYVARTKINSINSSDVIAKTKDLIEGLIIGGSKSNIIPNGFRSIIPSGTTVLDISLESDTVTVNFSDELLDINEKYEEKMIEAIVYTLTSLDNVDKVIIKVNGEVLTKLPNSGKNLPSVLDKSFGINKVYDISSVHNIDSFTVYYVNSYNDNSYYVPVTKYINNDNQDKIKVIIEQLSSAPIYESNLMSFLDVSAKLLDYSLEEEVIKLNFNNAILSDVTNSNILEEVVYTISLSMNDNYGVEEVIFCVDNEEIYKSLLKDIE